MCRHPANLAFLSVLVLAGRALAAGKTEPVPAPRMPVNDFSAGETCDVVEVVDGETVVLKIEGKLVKVRLIGVELAPLAPPPNRPGYGDEAFGFLTNLLKGEKVYVRRLGETPDGRGRRAAFLYRAPDGLLVNLEMVRQGYAQLSLEKLFGLRELFWNYAGRARAAQKGLWNPEISQTTTVKKIRLRLLKLLVENRNLRRKQRELSSAKPAATATYVFVTPAGKSYHRATCRFAKGAMKITLEEAKRFGYSPCKVCKPPE